jgi:hypothetical protein
VLAIKGGGDRDEVQEIKIIERYTITQRRSRILFIRLPISQHLKLMAAVLEDGSGT